MPPVALAPHVFKGYARILACMFHPHDTPQRRKFYNATVDLGVARLMANGAQWPKMPDEFRLRTITMAEAVSPKRGASPACRHSGNPL